MLHKQWITTDRKCIVKINHEDESSIIVNKLYQTKSVADFIFDTLLTINEFGISNVWCDVVCQKWIWLQTTCVAYVEVLSFSLDM